MKKKVLKIILVVIAAVLLWGTYLAVRAHSNLVTLNVHNADVREVVKKIEWQTWESIFVAEGVEGKITLNVHKVPLEEVLNIITEQSSCRWTAMYPLYSSGKSLVAFKKSMRGEVDPAQVGWTNYTSRGFFGGFGRGGGGMWGGGGNSVPGDNGLITMQVANKDLDVATTALTRYAQARVVPEDGTAGKVMLTLKDATFSQAMDQLGKQVHRKWTKYYVLQSWRGNRRGGDFAEGGNTNGPQDYVPTPEQRAAMAKRYEEQLETMSPEERARAEERRQRMEAMRNMTPEERQKAFEQMAQSPEFKQRMENRMMNGIRDTTPEQRVERAQRMAARQARRGQ